MITFDSVSKSYPDGTVAVGELSFTAPTGEITTLVGPSGCGKTTTLRMINRMIEPTGGRILIDGQDNARVPVTELRRGIGYVIQHAGLFPNYTIIDNISAVPLLLGKPKKATYRRAYELLELVGLETRLAKRYPPQLSGGQQQRVGVARALAADPPVMLMDEPFSAVDPIARTQLQDEFLKLQQAIEKTIVFVTHDIDEAIKLGDRVAVLNVGGELVQFAPPSTLLTTPHNAFVADFVGRDRGYRSLGFDPLDGLATRPEPTIEAGRTLAAARAAAHDDWILTVDASGRPLGWLWLPETDGRDAGTPVAIEMLNLRATFASASGTRREALDAVLSSPAGRGVVVDEGGRLAGTVTVDDVLPRPGTAPARQDVRR